MRLAWFSPLPPARSGIAACSADLIAALGGTHAIDVYVDEPLAHGPAGAPRPPRSAHEFVWRHQRQPYDLTVFQLGNSSHHDYAWPYLFRYPGLTVLHDAHLHHARAAALLRQRRGSDYRAEFAANHPEAAPGLAELAAAGFDSPLHYLSPMTRLVVLASRMVAVHSPLLAARLREDVPGARVEAIGLGHGVPVAQADRQAARRRLRERLGLPPDAVIVGAFGALTPEKRIPQILSAFAALRPYAPSARLLLAGAPASHYDAAADVAAHGVADRVVLTGYVESDDELTTLLAGTDVALTLRWPTAREVSGPWLRALAAGVPTVTIALAHMSHVPSLDPRTWLPSPASAPPVTVAIDLLDEDHSLRLALRRLAADAGLRAALAAAGRAYWDREHSVPRMADDYQRLLPLAAAAPAPDVSLPPHLLDAGGARLLALTTPFGCDERLATRLPRTGPRRGAERGAR